MIRVDPSPILFYFYFFIRSELVRVDPSWSGPTFAPACFLIGIGIERGFVKLFAIFLKS